MKKTSWGKVAAWYDDLLADDDSYQKKVILPNLLRLIDPKTGMTVLDVACGQGYFSWTLAKNGATVIGSDISKELIEIAKNQKVESSTIAKPPEFHVAPADKLDFAKDATADVVMIILAIQNIENLNGTFAECARVLKPGGRLFVVLNHPAFRIPKQSSWQWQDEKMYRRIDEYMSESSVSIDMTPGEKNVKKKIETVSFHRPLQVYFKALRKAGLAVTRLEEWISHKTSEPGPHSSEEDRMRKEIPMFLCLEAEKD